MAPSLSLVENSCTAHDIYKEKAVKANICYEPEKLPLYADDVAFSVGEEMFDLSHFCGKLISFQSISINSLSV